MVEKIWARRSSCSASPDKDNSDYSHDCRYENSQAYQEGHGHRKKRRLEVTNLAKLAARGLRELPRWAALAGPQAGS